MEKDYEIIKPVKDSDRLAQKMWQYQEIVKVIFFGKASVELRFFKKRREYQFILNISNGYIQQGISFIIQEKDMEIREFDYFDKLFNKAVEALKNDIIKSFCS